MNIRPIRAKKRQQAGAATPFSCCLSKTGTENPFPRFIQSG
ncbi:hypothetical protein ACAF76_004935 [Brevibacillus sp. TJ4]